MKSKKFKPIVKLHKTIATIGPTSNNKKVMEGLIENGTTVFRLNFSHGNTEQQYNTMKLARDVSQELEIPISIMLDTKGPEIRTHNFKNGHCQIKKNSKIKIFYKKEILGDSNQFSITYGNIEKDISVGQKILIDDGFLKLKIIDIDSEEHFILVEAINAHVLSNKKGLNIPGVELSMPFLSKQDQENIIFGAKHNVDYIAASFVRNKEDVLKIKRLVKQHTEKKITVISKIESQQALDKIDEILEVTDGIMVARGDLGVEIPYEDVPRWQKYLIYKSNELHKPVVVATQMLESMITNIVPTRAEVTDVYWAAELGCDSTMLSGETAKGDFPIQATLTMFKILKAIESDQYRNSFGRHYKRFLENSMTFTKEIVETHKFCEKNKKPLILIISDDSKFIDEVSLSHPLAMIFVFTTKNNIYTRYGVFYGVQTTLVTELGSISKKIIEEGIDRYGININKYQVIEFKK